MYFLNNSKIITYIGSVGCAPTSVGSGARSLTAIIDGVEIDFCNGNLCGNNRNCSASLFALILLKSFCKQYLLKLNIKLEKKTKNYL